jgi:PAS domain-containing protein
MVADFTYDWELWLNSDRSLRYCSPSCERITGRKAEEFIQQPDLLREIIVPEDKETWDTHVCNTQHGGFLPPPEYSLTNQQLS